MHLPDGGWALFRLTSGTTCGDALFEFLFFADEGSGFYSVSPNPTTTSISVYVDENKLLKNKIVKSNYQDIREVVIFDKSGRVVMRRIANASTRSISLDVSGLKTDMYLIRIKNSRGIESLKFFKK
jgi:hypothetical protein